MTLEAQVDAIVISDEMQASGVERLREFKMCDPDHRYIVRSIYSAMEIQRLAAATPRDKVEYLVAQLIHAWETGEQTGFPEFDEARSCEQAARFIVKLVLSNGSTPPA